MTFLENMVTLFIGLLMLVIGFATKKRWLKLLSTIPLAISIGLLAYLYLIAMSI